MADFHLLLMKSGHLRVSRRRAVPGVGDCVAAWHGRTNDRRAAWTMAVEAAAQGAVEAEVLRLVEGWGLTDEDGRKFCSVIGLRSFHNEGPGEYLVCIGRRPDLQWVVGIGPTMFDALVDYAKANGGLLCQ